MKTYFVRILPRAEVLDVQGRAVYQMLKNHQHPVEKVRVGKLIEVSLNDSVSANNQEILKKIIQEGLYNPLVETFEIEGL